MALCSLGAARSLTHLVGMVTGAHLGGGCGAQHRGWGHGRQAQKAGQGQRLSVRTFPFRKTAISSLISLKIPRSAS